MVVTAVLVIPPAPESEPLSVNLPTETVTPKGLFKVPFNRHVTVVHLQPTRIGPGCCR